MRLSSQLLMIPAGLLVVYLLWQFMPIEMERCFHHEDLRTAVWMGVTWSMDAHSADDLTDLAAELQGYQVKDAYIYVSYLRPGDMFNPTYDHAAYFLNQMRKLAPPIRWLAWIGVPINITQPDGTYIANRLEDPNIRSQIADFAAMTVAKLGFDGIHLNAELIPNDDPTFLLTLEAIRKALPNDAFFSTTAHALRSPTPITSIPYPTIAHHWTPDYLYEVALRVDQVALMAYDSGLPFPRDYRNWVAYQTQASALALSDLDTELFVGLPTSEEWTPSHQTQAETLAQALVGFKQADDPRMNGIALYPYWETTSDEWAQMHGQIC